MMGSGDLFYHSMPYFFETGSLNLESVPQPGWQTVSPAIFLSLPASVLGSQAAWDQV